VPFGIAARGVTVGVDVGALAAGQAVLPSESRSTAGEVPGVAPADTPPERPCRLLVEPVSAVEQPYVAGASVVDSNGRPTLKAGGGRPRIVCTLELPEAVRVLGGADRARAAGAAALLTAGCLLLVGALAVALVGPVRAAAPASASSGGEVAAAAFAVALPTTGTGGSPPIAKSSTAAGASLETSGPFAVGGASSSPLAIAGGDTRSSGTPPSFIGEPILAAFAVVVLGALTAGATLLYVRLAQRR
jgi:hypothetical protein